MKKVLINVDFKDRYTGEKHIAGKTEDMSEERVSEIKEVNPHFISVIGSADEGKKSDEDETEPEAAEEGKKSGKKDGKKAK